MSGLKLREEGNCSVRPDRTYDPDVEGWLIVAQHRPRNQESPLARVIGLSQKVAHRSAQLCEMNLAALLKEEWVTKLRLELLNSFRQRRLRREVLTVLAQISSAPAPCFGQALNAVIALSSKVRPRPGFSGRIILPSTSAGVSS